MTVNMIAFGIAVVESLVSSENAAADSYPAKIKSAESSALQNPENEGAVVGESDSKSLGNTPGKVPDPEPDLSGMFSFCPLIIVA